VDFYEQNLMGMKQNPTISVQRRQLQRYFKGKQNPASSTIRVLDLGCGDGEVTLRLFVDEPILENQNFDVIGVDISQKAVDAFFQNTGHEAVRSTALELPFPDSHFDIVIFNDVIEHLEDTDGPIKEVRRVLRDDGILLLSTPNLAAWFNRLLLLAGIQPLFSEVSFLKIFGRPGKDVVGHLRIFTTKALREFLLFHEFKIMSHKMATFQSVPKTLKPIDKFFTISKSLGANNVVLCQKSMSNNA
jgi:SAM-dependent methyltransferase